VKYLLVLCALLAAVGAGHMIDAIARETAAYARLAAVAIRIEARVQARVEAKIRGGVEGGDGATTPF